MSISDRSEILSDLGQQLKGEFHFSEAMRTLYATDASVYKSLPLAVAFPRDEEDIKTLITFARDYETSLIPRTAGTSLAGQCVGEGIVVDVSRHFNQILEVNKQEGWVRVQPGVIRDELNAFLQKDGLFFSPVTSTSNRAMVGGMIGNNSCGTNSIVYGTTRDHTLEIKGFLSDGSEVVFTDLDQRGWEEKLGLKNLEGDVYRHLNQSLSQPEVQSHIREGFPKKSITRRNTGYALDCMLDAEPFTSEGRAFNFTRLLCGSEGTLAFTTEAKLHLDPLPPAQSVLVAAHFNSISDCLKATQLAMKHRPYACEMMDKVILDCTKGNIQYSQYRFFIQGDPEGILLVEFKADELEEAEKLASNLVESLKENDLGYAYPGIKASEIKNVWSLRKAGLGLLANIPGDRKAVACIEDTAVDINDLPEYIEEFTALMAEFGQECVYYAHAGAGELHLRPILNLKKSEEVVDFYKISEASARLVKKYRGSLSGEHGDGRVRAAFIPLVMGEENYQLFKDIKRVWDPKGIFNPGKIVDAEPMDTSLRYESDEPTTEHKTVLDFSEVGGILRMAEKCNGSGDCRKLAQSGGTMCPSYQATRREEDSTRGRANMLRTYLTRNTQPNPFDHKPIKEVLDLCLSCKGCTSECPSNVDMASMKAEFLHQYNLSHGVPFRSKAFARINALNRLGSKAPGLTNWFLNGPLSRALVKWPMGVAKERELPQLAKTTLRKWFSKNAPNSPKNAKRAVYLFCDEFTNYYDVEIGIKTVELLNALGYEVRMVGHEESGRAAISKGLLEMAKKFANKNVSIFREVISENHPLIGIEPSAILSFRDEYPRLVDADLVEKAKTISSNTFLVEEFLSIEFQAGNIDPARFSTEKRTLLVHGHCHQKALSKLAHLSEALSIPQNFTVNLIPSGCCGMAGSFGYEAEHYGISMKIGEMVLFPAVRDAGDDITIVAPGTSCRHQIKDGTQRQAQHPVEVLHAALI